MTTAEDTLTAEGAQVTYQREGTEEPFHPRRLLSVPTRRNPVLAHLLDEIHQDERLHQLWRSANINAVDRSGMSDHGPVHIRIVANVALKLARLLNAADLSFNVVKNYGLATRTPKSSSCWAWRCMTSGCRFIVMNTSCTVWFLERPIARELLASFTLNPS